MRKSSRIYGNTHPVDLNVCTYCGDPIDNFSRTVDHLIPESRGGIRANKNKVPSCKSCNQLKDDMTPEEFDLNLGRMIRLVQSDNRRQIQRLKKIRINVAKIIRSRHNE